ncbi:MAG: antibiotic biosynthesis monooxygenase [Chloroflexi bacterium]|jgi:autoinducer 2-degrading protein|nr:antibiotic biosynthesis monooxygenase [Chloroflexota bacterium]
MVVLVARYIVQPGRMAEVEAALREMAAAVKRHEPGCSLYHVLRAREDPNVLLLIEHYADEAALAAHRATPHFQQLIEGRVVPLLERRERELYEPLIA